MVDKKGILLAFYGDDFTGSTDALEFLSKAGAKTVLFLTNPTKEQLVRFEGLDAFGIAGMTRAMQPEEMQKELEEAFSVISAFSPNHVHYKVCSTFDSSPTIGNIGTAISVGQRQYPNVFVPVLVAAPNLGRYSAFGNLYARMGIGSDGEIYRLDRHPSMSKHPVTPAKESDLRLHLAKQTNQDMGLVDLEDLGKGFDAAAQKLNQEISKKKTIIFFDAMYESQMKTIGRVLDGSRNDQPLFSVGSSGIEKALGDYWFENGLLDPRDEWESLKDEGPVLVLSGSASPITGDQIDYAVNQGFEHVEVTPEVFEEDKTAACIESYAQKIVASVEKGKSVILHTCRGPEDSRIKELKKFLKGQGWDSTKSRKETPKQFGKVLGSVAKKTLKNVKVNRLIIAGGDTSSYVARELGIVAVEMIAPVFTGAPMCHAYAPGSPVDGLQVNLKGGQVGDETYFVSLQKGKLNR